MKKLFLYVFLSLLWCGSVIASEEKLWKHGDDYLTPQCFVYEWSSGDNIEEYFNRYSPAIIKAYAREKYNKIQNTNFIFRRPFYFSPRYIPVGEKFKASGGDTLSLTTYLKDCAKSNYTETDKSKNYYEVVDNENINPKTTFRNLCLTYAPGLISTSKAKCLDIKTIAYTEVFKDKSKPPVTQYNVYGIYELDGEKIILLLRFNEEIFENKIKKTYSDIYSFINLKDDNKTIIYEKGFYDALGLEVNDYLIYLGMTKNLEKQPLHEVIINLLPNGDATHKEIEINNEEYFVVSGCRRQSCPEKGFLWIDRKNKIVLGGLIHYLLDNKDSYNEDGDLLIFSKKFNSYNDLPVKFIKDLENWLSVITTYDITERKDKQLVPKNIRFLNSKNELKQVSRIK